MADATRKEMKKLALNFKLIKDDFVPDSNSSSFVASGEETSAGIEGSVESSNKQLTQSFEKLKGVMGDLSKILGG